ncbi:hypothetical protein DRO97_01290 [Archaeoglobales archaeon]|nr:MAG: hypothetical protein DRO97_01290 [Archaeoglobales archaeon]
MYLYPKEIISDIYVSKLGGFSYEVERNEVGINSRAIEVNTSIIANETFAKLKFFNERIKPYFLRGTFRIVGIEEYMDSYDLSRNGEIVLSEELEDKFREKEGKEVIINTVESFRIDEDYRNVINAFKRIWRSENLTKRN